MEKAIKKAIEGGYKIQNLILKDGELFAFGRPDQKVIENRCLLDPLFWQALGKAEGWNDFAEGIIGWKHYLHSFIDHIIEGKSPDSFFESLLT